MPELPEVQTVINSLKPLIINKKIKEYNELWHKVNYNKNNKDISSIIEGKKITSLNRLGKHIIIQIDEYYITFHLRMTGYLYSTKNLPENKKHIRCYFNLSSNLYLIFEDIRKFGGFYLTKDIIFLKEKLGIDALDRNLDYLFFKKNFIKKTQMIKYFLLDQSNICGLGNIYIDEILWATKINPKKTVSSLNKKNINALLYNTIKILSESIRFHGTTILNFKFDNMKTGNYKAQLNAYGRENLDCKECNNKIKKIKLCGRSTYFCKNCQKI
ncbi:MAG: hypothetical protein CMG64_02710 [Candidatus Marinimicrobia bacterium]|nr:hypothetical protein [Candidatus Neomarinimicrobiota bacterium]